MGTINIVSLTDFLQNRLFNPNLERSFFIKPFRDRSCTSSCMLLQMEHSWSFTSPERLHSSAQGYFSGLIGHNRNVKKDQIMKIDYSSEKKETVF